MYYSSVNNSDDSKQYLGGDLLSREFDFAVVGNVGIDTNVYLQGEEIDFSREANFTENMDNIGQAGGYTALGFARLGMRTSFIGYIGDDVMGKWIRSEFRGIGIDDSGFMIDPAGTSRSVNIMNSSGLRKNFYDGKTHMNLHPPQEKYLPILRESRAVHFHIPNWARYLLKPAAAAGSILSCDLQDVTDINDPYRADFIKSCRILFLSAVNHESPVPVISAILNSLPDRIVIAGMGSRGVALGNNEGIRFFPAIESGSPVVDTNGAGDSLAVGFLTSYVVQGLDLEESVMRGQTAARHACSLKGNSVNLITMAELDGRAGCFKSP
ncbi:MAG: carbohydrate kinase family protein [Candidatus Wallbacteria bacterium HGW-Wallbacteria-1]|uniref:Carbohydrate kinase family protein n=1 Tax=Candidatus Wallbacteria bacterium HGW-Wallbacteria-1 TaxID=2013854 RepID=A0A2N1PRI8_9BACT|nr:MAG: carbohydrate kinase family protein [Candidatus Wallbacteria bacterium HGW-Wallbacteria-1]